MPSFIRRHTEGWPLLVVAVGIALISTVLVVPRPTPPADVLPLPHIDRAELHAALQERGERSRRAIAEALPYDVRAVGEMMRRFGRITADSGEGAGVVLNDLRVLAERARAQYGDEPLLRLRAVQGELFEAALVRFEQTDQADDELRELGGKFLETARASGWLQDGRLLLGPEERQALFEIRWADLTGLSKIVPFAPTLGQWRTYYGFLLRQPADAADARDADQRRLAYAMALGRLDPEYEVSLARGLLHVRLGEYAAATRQLQAYLAANPRGRWQLIARNQLAMALVSLGTAS